ncbi:unnamed protein product [Staurois parvus]|uniref:Uncharacterized protein n=1 Tax=Staurois parvus TaxID=386267 RepID=A0ABN9BB82_9NEOB|nr:unnamed protein product [Staurois parvus]
MSPLQCLLQCPPASVFWVPFPATSGRMGDGTGGKSESCKIKHYCIKPFHIHFVPSALSCVLPAFLLFFLPGN